MAYDSESAIVCLSAHVPQNLPKSPQPPLPDTSVIQTAENRVSPEGTEDSEGSGIPNREACSANLQSSEGLRVDSLHSGSDAAVAVVPADRCGGTLNDAMVEGEI